MSVPIILVEDNASIRELLRDALAEVAGTQILAEAETADEAIEAFRVHGGVWQVAILDLFLREGHGLDVLRASPKTRSNQRIFLLTNYATPEIRRRALAAGADAVFDKSTEVDEFLAAFKALAVRASD